MAAPRFRQRKVPVKQHFSIIREKDFDATFDDESRNNAPAVVTGVDEKEEVEFHLQAIISRAAGTAEKPAYIPTPPTNVSGVQYERLYSANYKHPHSYIRFSSTVEDSTGIPYCMDLEDAAFLQKMNLSPKKSPSKRLKPCTEDQFEEVMSFFEETSLTKQPYATVDNAPILTYEEMETFFDETIDDSARLVSKDVYPHWKRRRSERVNHPLMPTLKFEKNVDADDSDPYVCFRRREVRQARKTRARDAQITEKLKKLRVEMEQARLILHYTKQREVHRKDQMLLDRQIFDHRVAVKEARRNLGIKADDTDLINQRPVERIPKPDSTSLRKLVPPGEKKEFQDSSLHLLSEDRAKRENDVNQVVNESMAKHKVWNSSYVDNTWRPITPPLESGFRNTFREAITEYLPTPPASSSEEQNKSRDPAKASDQTFPFRYASPPMETATPGVSFRRRIGRNGRMWIDRRGLTSRKRKRSIEDASFSSDDDSVAKERAAFDIESDEEPEFYFTNSYDRFHMRHRVEFAVSSAAQALAHQQQQQISAEHRKLQELRLRQQQQQNTAGSSGAQASLTGANASRVQAVK